MTIEIQWIASLLNPRDVAPHPNFMSSEKITGAGLLALVVQLRIHDYDRLRRGVMEERTDERLDSLPERELFLVDSARNSVLADRQGEGAAALLSAVSDEGLPLAARGAAALLATVALSELDDFDAVLDLLHTFSEDLLPSPGAEDGDARLLAAVISQQLALRSWEAGILEHAHAGRVLELLEGLRQSDFTSFPTTQGVAWRSPQTISQIVSQLRATAEAHLANTNEESYFTDWARFVRRPAPTLTLRLLQSIDSSYGAYLKELFRSEVAAGERSLFSQDPVDPPVSATLLHYGLLGDLAGTRKWRTRLAMLRLLRPGEERVWSRRECVRLLRHSQDLNELSQALRDIRAGGPLEALAVDAAQIVQRRLPLERLRLAEMAVLEAAAHVLPTDQAGTAFDAVLRSIANGVPALERGGRLTSVKLEKAWAAAAALAAPAGRLERFAEQLLAACRTAPDDELLVNGLARAAREIEWEQLPAAARSEWGTWLRTGTSLASRTMRGVIGPELRIEIADNISEVVSLDEVAVMLNTYFHTSEEPSAVLLQQAVDLTVRALRHTRSEAARGVYGFGSVSEADIAAGLGLHLGAEAIWEPLRSYLLDPQVNASSKISALERLAQPDSNPPEVFLRSIEVDLGQLLRSRSVGFFANDQVGILPAALRFIVRHGLQSDESVVTTLSKLAASEAAEQRMEAARTLTLIARLGAVADWVVVTTVHLSNDPSPQVRAEAGRALGLLWRLSSRFGGLVEDRLVELLLNDGLLVPLLVLRGLLDADRPSPGGALGRRIAQMATSHPAHGVRLQASALLT